MLFWSSGDKINAYAGEKAWNSAKDTESEFFTIAVQ
jgi:hypothetical protein